MRVHRQRGCRSGRAFETTAGFERRISSSAPLDCADESRTERIAARHLADDRGWRAAAQGCGDQSPQPRHHLVSAPDHAALSALDAQWLEQTHPARADFGREPAARKSFMEGKSVSVIEHLWQSRGLTKT